MLNSKEGFDCTLSMHQDIFPVFNNQDLLLPSGGLCFFTESEIVEIKTRINDFEFNYKSRNNGSALKKEVEKIAYFKKGLLEHIQEIKDILSPKERSRTTVKEAEALAEQRSINNLANSYVKAFADEKLLRGYATTILGDVQGDYTVQELPVVIATKQITGVLMSIS